MDQIKIKIVKSQLVKRGLEGLLRSLIAGILHPQLGGDEQFFAGNTGLLNSSAHALLVHIGRRCVDQPVAHRKSIGYTALTFLGGNLKYAVSLLGHFHTIVEFNCIHKNVSS